MIETRIGVHELCLLVAEVIAERAQASFPLGVWRRWSERLACVARPEDVHLAMHQVFVMTYALALDPEIDRRFAENASVANVAEMILEAVAQEPLPDLTFWADEDRCHRLVAAMETFFRELIRRADRSRPFRRRIRSGRIMSALN